MRSRAYAVLIDAGFLKRKLGSRECPLTAETTCRFVKELKEHPQLSDLHLHRVYFYDAPPLTAREHKPLGGGSIEFANTQSARTNQRLHKDLRDVPFISLRMGKLRFNGWKLNRRLHQDDQNVVISAKDLRPNIHQKAVDMRLGLDIASITLKKHADIIVLVAGDSDFVPAMKFARREGAQVFLVTFDHPIYDEVREHADLVLKLPLTIPT